LIATTRHRPRPTRCAPSAAHEVVDTRDAGKWVDAVMRATGAAASTSSIDHVGGPMLADNIRVPREGRGS